MTVWHGTLGREAWQPKNPRLIKTWKRDGFTMPCRTAKEFPVKIGRETYVPYKFMYDPDVKDYVWKFKRRYFG